jgi:hypothetical protein
MTDVERLAEFVVQASYDDLSTAARSQLKIHVLDARLRNRSDKRRTRPACA